MLIQRNLQNEKQTSSFYSIEFSKLSQISQLPSTWLQPYFRVLLGSKWFDSSQPESGVFSRILQFESTRVDSNQPGLEAV